MFDSYSTAVNEDYHQIVNGSCKDTFSMNETAWQNTYNNPPTVLVQDYYKCKYTLQNSVINAIGVGSGTAAALIPAAIIIWIIIIQSCGFKKAVLRKELYTERELDHAKNWWATQMLIMRDLHFTRKRTNGPPLNAATKAFVDLMLDSDHNVEVSQHTLSRHHTYSYHTYSQYRILETTSHQRILSSHFVNTSLSIYSLCLSITSHQELAGDHDFYHYRGGGDKEIKVPQRNPNYQSGKVYAAPNDEDDAAPGGGDVEMPDANQKVALFSIACPSITN